MSSLDEIRAQLNKVIAVYPDFPKKGILFEDILPIFQDAKTFQLLIDALKQHIAPLQPTVIIGLDARGFLFGPTLALQLGVSFVPVRKAGKLPGDLYTAAFEKEYGTDSFALQKSAVKSGDRVVIVDDIIATGGSAEAAGNLAVQAGAKVLEYVFLKELLFLKGRERLNAPVFTLLEGQD